MEKIVIIGGGFAGINLVKHLDRKRFDIHVIDRNNFHCFPPLFYQIASAGLEPSDISFPLRREFKKYGHGVTYHMGHVKGIDTRAHTVNTSYETISYDRLVIAAGTTNNFFGIEGMEKRVFCIKTVAEAAYTRDEILDRLERAAMEQDPDRRRKLLSFMVVGGGPAGVEIAGALGEMKRDVVPREYPELNPDDISITLVEGAPEVLAAMGHKAAKLARKYLEDFMVEVRTSVTLTGYDNKIATYSDGTSEHRETLIWTAGVTGEPMPGLPKELLTRGGRIAVDEYNRATPDGSLLALGDIALMTTDDYPKGHPQVAQVAIQMARNLAHNLNRGVFGKPFRYNDRGSMATVGKHRAVTVVKGVTFGGWVAWMMWMFIHLISILGMRNKLSVLTNWVWNYMTHTTSLRLLLRPAKWPERRHWAD